MFLLFFTLHLFLDWVAKLDTAVANDSGEISWIGRIQARAFKDWLINERSF